MLSFRFDGAGVYVKPLCFAKRVKRDLEWLDMQVRTDKSYENASPVVVMGTTDFV